MLSTLLFLASAFAGSLCNDGWVSPSTGPGTCSHHGGVAGGGSYYIPPSTPRASTTSTYRPPPPADELGAWVRSSGVTDSGMPYFDLIRYYADFSPSLKIVHFNYSCFQLGGDLPNGEKVILVLDRQEKYSEPTSAQGMIPRAEASDPYLQVWATTSSSHTRLYGWYAEVTENGNLLLMKITDNITFEGERAGDPVLTQEDIKTIVASDKLTVFVTSTTGVDEFEIPMMGAATNIAATRAQCTQAAAAN